MQIEETFANNISERVKKAIITTLRLEEGHWEETLTQRSGLSLKARQGGGSWYPAPIEEIEADLLVAKWYGYPHPKIMKGCFGAVAPRMPGMLGVVPLADLPPDTTFVLIDFHAEPGYCELLLEGATRLQNVGHTTLILGPRENGEEEIVWTFHPGDPIDPSEVFTKKGALKKGNILTHAEALVLGFTHTKVV